MKLFIEKYAVKSKKEFFRRWGCYILLSNFVQFNFKRQIVSRLVIKTVIEQGSLYGIMKGCKKEYKFLIDYDDEFVTTNIRLHMLKDVTVNILRSQGYHSR